MFGFTVGLLGLPPEKNEQEKQLLTSIIGLLEEYSIGRAAQASLDGKWEGFNVFADRESRLPAEIVEDKGYVYTDVLKNELRERRNQLLSGGDQEELIKRLLEDVELDSESFIEIEILHECLESDVGNVKDTHWKSAQASEVVQFLYSKTHGSNRVWVSKSELKTGIDSAGKSTVGLTNKLSTGGDEKWAARPLVETKTPEDWGEVKLTDYGKLVGYRLENGDLIDELHDFALERGNNDDEVNRLIHNALAEVDEK